MREGGESVAGLGLASGIDSRGAFPRVGWRKADEEDGNAEVEAKEEVGVGAGSGVVAERTALDTGHWKGS